MPYTSDPKMCNEMVIRADATVSFLICGEAFTARWNEELLNAEQFLEFTKEVAREP